MNALIRLGGYSAIAGGALKLLAACVPYTPQSVGLELLYGMIDAALLLSLIAVYLVASDRIGAAGLTAFVIALLALASILGPEANMFGVDFYFAGGAIFSFALAAFAIQLMRQRMFQIPASLWIASAVIGIALSATGAVWAFLAAGVILSAGFVAAGYQLLQQHPTRTS